MYFLSKFASALLSLTHFLVHLNKLQVDAYETEVGILEKTLKQLKAHEWGRDDNHKALLDALGMERGQQAIQPDQRTTIIRDILNHQMQQVELLRQAQLEQECLAMLASEEYANDEMVRELQDLLQLTDAQKQDLLASSQGLDKEVEALETIAASLQAMQENDWLLNEGVQAITDQFTSMGGTEMAIAEGARTVDHLEAATPETIRAVGGSATIAVILPCSGYALDGRYAPARALVDAGAAVAIGSNANPGSAPTVDLRLAMHLAVRHAGLDCAEAIVAATVNAAHAIGAADEVGMLAPGMRANLMVLEDRDERSLVHAFGGPPPRVVVLGGRVLQG